MADDHDSNDPEEVFGPPPVGTQVKTIRRDVEGGQERRLRCHYCCEQNEAWRTRCRVCRRAL